MSKKPTAPKKLGRPPADTEPITLRLPHDVLAALDAMRQSNEFPPNRQEAIRVLLTQQLRERGFLK
jgi:Arc/MetJ-type ribon-helix-helix transcriptional regulator